MWAVYLPTSIYFAYLSLRARSLFFFSATNPSIENGGMFFEDKKKVYALIPDQLYPSTVYVETDADVNFVLKNLKENQMNFPLVAKPTRGERGWLVKIIYQKEELENYMRKVNRPFLLQTYVDYPIELSIFYVRHPANQNGKITSITGKKFLRVVGDGKRTVLELILRDPRAFLQLDVICNQTDFNKEQVLALGEEKILVRIGNHARGTTFLNMNSLIDEKLTQVMDSVAKSIPGFYFGRFDLVCKSVEKLKEGNDFFILELNGAGAEPAHIYQPGYSYFKAQKDLMHHFKMMYDIATYLHKQGQAYISFSTYKQQKKEERIFKGSLQNSSL